MPYKAFSQPKKLTNLGAAVTAGAQLDKDRHFVAISSDPVKLAAMALTGGPTKATNVTLDTADAMGLISKMVAVVKSGSNVWALLDIRHSPKVEQVGRDNRYLAGCPQGGMALGVGWDGQGHEYTLVGNDVEPRSFVLRGDVRAISLNDGMCHTVVDGAGGGQYRGHPGNTPEPGPSARANLPGEAKTFQHLAGGAKLSALYAPGNSSVCVVRRDFDAGGTMTAKMVGLDQPVSAAAVIDTTLFVACADGRLRAYGADALRLAGASPMAATAERPLGDEPCSLTATTAGGKARLWVGTRGGNVVMFEAAQGTLDL